MLDVGGSHVKLMIEPDGEIRKIPTGPRMTPKQLIRELPAQLHGWHVTHISIGYPGIVRNGRPWRDPLNLGRGWVGFDYEDAFGYPVRFINDAAMQALGNYKSGRFLFFGLGTSTGACLIADEVIIPVEIGLMRLREGHSFCKRLSKAAFHRLGQKRWSSSVNEAIEQLRDIFRPDLIVVGGGNARKINPLPDRCRLVENASAYLGAQRLWEDADSCAMPFETTWRLRHT
jgi:polyphosphate glucokinase